MSLTDDMQIDIDREIKRMAHPVKPGFCDCETITYHFSMLHMIKICERCGREYDPEVWPIAVQERLEREAERAARLFPLWPESRVLQVEHRISTRFRAVV